MTLLQRLWHDETAFVASSDLILISTILVIGSLVGLVTMRDQVVQEFGDLAVAIGNLNQSYSFAGSTMNGSTVAGSSFADMSDSCEEGTAEGDANNDVANQPPECIEFVPAEAE